MVEKFEPIVVPYKTQINKFGNKSKSWFTYYMSYCSVCGNPIIYWTNTYYCRYCRCNIDWSKHMNKVSRMKLNEYAIKQTIDKI